MPKVSVVIPVYGVENYIERCVRSLFGQTLEDIEFIFVDDRSPDNSIEVMHNILEEFPLRKNQVRCIRHDKNYGLAVARATGMRAATGEYTISCDSDDWVELNMYEVMYNVAKLNDADFSVCDVVYHYQKDKVDYFHNDNYVHPRDMLTCGKYIRLWSIWSRMIRTDLIRKHQLYPIPGADMWEDLCVVMLVTYYSNKMVQVHEPLYHYDNTRCNTIASSTMTLDKLFQQIANLREVFRRFEEEKFDMGDTGMIYKKYVKDCLLLLKPIPWKVWSNTFPEVADYVDKDTSCSQLYKMFYRWANKGFYAPLKMQMRLWAWRNGRH